MSFSLYLLIVIRRWIKRN